MCEGGITPSMIVKDFGENKRISTVDSRTSWKHNDIAPKNKMQESSTVFDTNILLFAADF